MSTADLSQILHTLHSASASNIEYQVQSQQFNGMLKAISTELPTERSAILELAKSFSVAPISGFHVGAFAIGVSGNIYLGANMEFSGVPLNASLHAEQSAVLNAWMHGERKLTALHVSELPCGHCRQFLRELSGISKVEIHIGSLITNIDTLLPHPFADERPEGQGLLDSPHHVLEPIRSTDSDLVTRAINAAQLSYTPYSANPAGCVLETTSGKFFAGRSAESAAFNPSVAAITCALNQRNLSAHRKELIQSCTLAKLATGINSQYDLVVSLLKGICHTEIYTVLLEQK